LDLRDVHRVQQGARPRRHGRRPSRRQAVRGRRGPGRAPQILPVGRFRVVLPSGVLLLSQVRVENVGKRPDRHARPRSRLSDGKRREQSQADKDVGRVLHREPARAQPVRRPVFPVRGVQLFQRRRANILRRLLPGRRVQQIRARRPTVHRHGPGGQAGRNVQSVSKGDQVHVSQVRPVREHPENRRPVLVAAERRQRTDLRVDMVLVRVRRRAQLPQYAVPCRCPAVAEIPHHVVGNQIAFGPQGRREKRLQQVPGRRLVRVVPAEQEHRAVDFQGARVRNGYEVRR